MTTIVQLEPGSAEWYRYMTASKVAAVLGESRWQSPRSLWHLMHGDVEPEAQTVAQARGHYLEPAILEWFFDQHPELYRRYNLGTYVDDWKAATPDSVGWDADRQQLFPVEAKTDGGDFAWGEPGTDEIPTEYALQGMWTMHVLGAERIYFPLLTTRLRFVEYHLDYSAEVGAYLEAKCRAFLDSLLLDSPPELDDHTATYEVLRRLHPEIDRETSVELDEETARLFIDATLQGRDAEARCTYAKTLLTEVMGTAHKAYHDGHLIAYRKPSSSGTPYPQAARTLPVLGDPA
jgi:predicted phage-related endonuclease